MEKYELTRSMSKKASTPDNARAESLFGHLKTEFFYNQSWQGVSVQDFMNQLNPISSGITPSEEKIL
jgi:transposase InsO family protein